jgi:hypothetical protein
MYGQTLWSTRAVAAQANRQRMYVSLACIMSISTVSRHATSNDHISVTTCTSNASPRPSIPVRRGKQQAGIQPHPNSNSPWCLQHLVQQLISV